MDSDYKPWKYQIAIVGPSGSGKKTLFQNYDTFKIMDRSLDEFDELTDDDLLIKKLHFDSSGKGTQRFDCIRGVVVVISSMMLLQFQKKSNNHLLQSDSKWVINEAAMKKVTDFCKLINHKTKNYPNIIVTHCDWASSCGIELKEFDYRFVARGVPDNHSYFFGKTTILTKDEIIEAFISRAQDIQNTELYDLRIHPNVISLDSNKKANDTISEIVHNLKCRLSTKREIFPSLLSMIK